ncbi:MAG: protein-glutamate O-methyltransferase CheR [Nitrospiraceae bacterium]|nr:protein-glutamate O-methyltransferase CheR [Nitrospiraceae bacterium]MDA8434102.1 protein-glutamate O-methyltransferase CheR [Nitrospiraceae bacterium]
MGLHSKKEVMTEEDFSLLRDLVRREFGVLLKGDKRLTLHAKVSHRLGILGLGSYREYYDYILSDPSKDELYTLASHITNNETYFFRERVQLDVFLDLLKEIKREKQRRRQNRLRILSVASSSGEEVYTLNIIVQESGLFAWDWDVLITGIDINRNAVRKAQEACYSQNSFRSLNGDAGIAKKYFTADKDRFRLRKFFKKNVEFRHGNILDRNAFGGLCPVDVVFCRNALIYMSDEAIAKIVGNFFDCIDERGYLFVGSSESLIQRTNLFLPEYVDGIIVYRKNARGNNALE